MIMGYENVSYPIKKGKKGPDYCQIVQPDSFEKPDSSSFCLYIQGFLWVRGHPCYQDNWGIKTLVTPHYRGIKEGHYPIFF